MVVGLALLLLGFSSGAGAAIADEYLHRGVESGTDRPYIVQPTGKVLATNIDLRRRSEENLTSVADTLTEGGFLYVRQTISWGDIETAQGEFNWTELDLIAEVLGRQNIMIIAVITDTPDWARTTADISYANAPPTSASMLESFTTALTDRYKGAIPFVQIWNDPNLASNWGGEPATGSDFAPYLRAAWTGALAGYEEARVLTPELALESDAVTGPTDLRFLQQLYDVNADDYFDVLAIQLDGSTYSPDDRRVGESRENFSRAILFRELMVANGDPETPIWATSFGWAVSEAVTAEEQAEFAERALERSWSEWPWMGLMVQWSFLERFGSGDFPYAVLRDGDGTPLWYRLSSPDISGRADTASTGFSPMDAPSIVDSGNWQDQHLEGRTFRTTKQVGSTVTITFQGTGLIVFLRSGPDVGLFTVHVDGKLIEGGGGKTGNEWDLSFFSTTTDLPRTLISGLDDSVHTMTITLTGPGELTLGGVEVTREAPFVWPIVLVTAGSLICLFFGVRSIAYLVATRAGLLRRSDDPDFGPPLPRMPNIRQPRRLS